MKRTRFKCHPQVFFLLTILITAFNPLAGQVIPGMLRCEYLVNPIGLDALHPRLTWQITSEKPGVVMQACQVFVSTDSLQVTRSAGEIWDSGIIKSSVIPVVYSGQELKPQTRYYWSVRVQDIAGNWSGLSRPAFFETGMMGKNLWKGSWITDTYDFNLKPAPIFRKSFTITGKVKSARVYIAVAGLYELYINGKRIGDHRLDPMFTRFDRRTLYVTYDVTDQLQTGENVIGVILGNGWYNHQPTAVWYFDKAPWRARPRCCLDLRIEYSGGSAETIATGAGWKYSYGEVVYNSIYTAEHHDARQSQKGWNMPGFNDSKWNNVLLTGAPSSVMVAQAMHPVRNTLAIDAAEVKKSDDSTFLFDFGRTIAGVTRLTISGEAGTTFRIRHAEKTDSSGHADQSNIIVHYRPTGDSDPFQTDIYVLRGEGVESFMPRFNYKGFRYAEVSADRPVDLSKTNLTAFFMHSDVPAAGHIRSSNPLLDKIWEAGNNSYLSNLFGYPTDCPQREKNGWTGDAHINIETGLYNFDGITVYEKWMADHRDEQQANGVLPAIIPTGGWGYHWANGPDWTSTIAIIPWEIYLFYGDSRLLENCYDNIRRYVDHITDISAGGLTDWGLGDWVPVRSKTPKEFTSSVYFFVDATILAKAAGILGKHGDYEKYTALAEKIRSAINAKYLDTNKGIYGTGTQTAMSSALHWGIVPPELVAKVARNLADSVLTNNSHIDVGLLGTKTVLNALSENGYGDLAYRVALQETYPSWGWWIVNGATTFYENWPLDAARDASMNHIMFGEISAWFYKAPGGIFPDEEQPGFKNIILKPCFVSGLDRFEASHDGPYGTIVSAWEKRKNIIAYHVIVPANSTATLTLPSGKITESGKILSENRFIRTIKTDKPETRLHLLPGNFHFEIRK